MDSRDYERRVDKYLLRELGKESELRELTLGPYDEVSRPMKFFFHRMVELNWTLQRFFRNLRAIVKPDSSDFAKREAERRSPPQRTSNSSNSFPRILLDMTDAHRTGKYTGIQRVVREITRHAAELGQGLPVIIENGGLLPYYRGESPPDNIAIQDGDIFVMLDATWNNLAEYLQIMREISSKGGANVTCLYDLLPLMFPQAFPPSLVPLFDRWFKEALTKSDAVVAISQSAANDLLNYLKTDHCTLKPNFRIGWWRLGADFADSSKDDVSSKAKSLAHGAPYFLSVGTLEPRKSYPVALEAFERLWRAGKDVRYAIVGRRGWSARHIVKHILEHPEYEHRLFWFDDAGDADLDFLYKHARAVVAPSFAEGFGLPIVEAARHGLPTIASDIPVFREVGGDAIAYFDCLDSNSLADRIAEFLEAPKAPQDLPETSWRESTKLLLSLIRDEAYQLSLREPA